MFRMAKTADSEIQTADLGRALSLLLRAHQEALSDVVGDFPYGQRGYQTLCEVVRCEQPSQLTLANRLGIDRTVMTYLIDDLVEAGLVERQANPDDRRQRRIVATKQGRAAVARLCKRVAEAESTLLSSLSAREQATLRRLLHSASAGIAPLVEATGPSDE